VKILKRGLKKKVNFRKLVKKCFFLENKKKLHPCLGSIILGEGLDLTSWPGASLFRQELKGAVSWCGELTMGHDC